jgi:dTDP-4-amino-4,6-dideoxygalactose transaminase
MIPFNKPYISGNELNYIKQTLISGKISGDGIFTKRVHEYFESRFSNKCLLTTSCTDALEMASILINIEKDDEIIVPAYTFVSTANAFVLRGAKLVFADSRNDHPGIDENRIESLITNKTKAIVVVHYAGVACNMDIIMSLSQKYKLFIIEDAAQAINSYYIDKNKEKKPLGTIGHLGTYSFHETKNIICGEGGMLLINDKRFNKRAEIIREKGTNRSAFFRGEIDKYGWVDIGSSFLPSDILASFLFAQLENIDKIQTRRFEIWNRYLSNLTKAESNLPFTLPKIPDYSVFNAHMFYVVFDSIDERTRVICELKSRGIQAVFHYISLNKSSFFNKKFDNTDLTNSDRYTDCLLRLPFYYEIENYQIDFICDIIINMYK